MSQKIRYCWVIIINKRISMSDHPPHTIIGTIPEVFTPGWNIYEPRLAPHVAKPDFVDKMLADGEDPKPLMINECKPQCTFWKEKLERCERQLVDIIKVNPTKSCMYPFRDYVTCIEACAQPVIHNQLKGTSYAATYKPKAK